MNRNNSTAENDLSHAAAGTAAAERITGTSVPMAYSYSMDETARADEMVDNTMREVADYYQASGQECGLRCLC